MKNLIEKYQSLGYVLTVKEELNIALCMKAKSKARFPKALFNYRFKSPERMAEYCSEWIERVEKNINSENERKAKKKEAQKMFPSIVSLIDKLSKKNIIHANKAANLKSKLTKHIASL